MDADRHDDHHRGLSNDLARVLTRRRALVLLATSVAAGVAACDRLPLLSQADAETTGAGPDGTECVVHPSETAGPFPADGSNRAHGTLANVLTDSGVVRQDMRTSLNGKEASADGAALRLTIALVSVGPSCTPLAGHAIYLWHCDAAGRYSIYDLAETSYLRAVGVTDSAGKATFDTIVPGCYPGRYPHMHFEVYATLSAARDYRNRLLTSQLAIPADVCHAAYRAHPAYRESIASFAESPLERDGIFRDNTAKQLAAQMLAVAKAPQTGAYVATVTIGMKPTAA